MYLLDKLGALFLELVEGISRLQATVLSTHLLSSSTYQSIADLS